jgi:hypothetical protein
MTDAAAPPIPILVTGYPRSGTTLLYRALAEWPEFACSLLAEDMHDAAIESGLPMFLDPTLDYGEIYHRPWPQWRLLIPDERLFHRHVMSARGVRRWYEAALTRAVFTDGALARAGFDVESLAVRQRLGLGKRRALRAAAMRVSHRRAVTQGFFHAVATSRRVPRVLDKYPFYYYRFDQLRAVLRDVRFLYIYRHPLDVFASMVRRARIEINGGRPAASYAWLVLSPELFAEDWSLAMAEALGFASRRPRSILLVKYEELTTRPSETLDGIAAFLEVPARGKVAPTPPADQQLDDRRRFPLLSSQPMANSGRHVGALHPQDVRTLNRLTAEWRRRLGYR